MAANNGNTEQAILKAAEEEFIEKGLAGARTVSIAEKAGVTHAMLHYYFRSKEQLYEKILEGKIDEVFASVKDAFTVPEMPLEERIKCMVRNHFNFVRKTPGLPLFIIRELTTDKKRLEIFLGRAESITPLVKEINDALEEAVSEGRIAPISITDLVTDVVTLNVAPFIMSQLARPVLDLGGIDTETFLDQRLEENIELITRRLEP